jgi:hypothetical protein
MIIVVCWARDSVTGISDLKESMKGEIPVLHLLSTVT